MSELAARLNVFYGYVSLYQIMFIQVNWVLYSYGEYNDKNQLVLSGAYK